jgi:hypothetical protein
MFLTVAHVRAADFLGEVTFDDNYYEATPYANLTAFEIEDTAVVEIPEGDWDLNYLAFILVPVDES